MKNIIQPAKPEVAEHFCDFTNQKLPWGAAANFSISFGYNSDFDGCHLFLELNNEASKELLEFIRSKLSPETKKHLAAQLKKLEENLDNSIQSRDWDQSDYYHNDISLIKYISN